MSSLSSEDISAVKLKLANAARLLDMYTKDRPTLILRVGLILEIAKLATDISNDMVTLIEKEYERERETV